MSEKNKGNNHLRFTLPSFDVGASSRLAREILDEAGVSAALIGRFAVWTWIEDPSHHELTKDIDLAVRLEDIQGIAEALRRRDDLVVSDLEIGGINVRAAGGVSVDFIHRQSSFLGDLSPLFDEAITAARESGSTVEIQGDDYPIVPLEHLVAMKIATAEEKDRKDATRLLAHAREEVDVGRVRELLASHGGPAALALFEQVLRDVGHPGAHGQGRYKSPAR